MNMSSKSGNPGKQPESGGGGDIHPLVALVLAVFLAAAVGVVEDWPTAVTVLATVLGFFSGSRTVADGRHGEQS
ncbi:hypothetical protein ACWCPQ_26860 [Nocardia sp. NPDC001965]